MMQELELIKNIDILAGKKIVLFGASSVGSRIQHYLNLVGFKVYGYCDNSDKKWGTLLNGVKIYSPKELESYENKQDLVIIVSSTYIKEIIGQLKESALWVVPTYTYVALEYSVCFCYRYKRLPDTSRSPIEYGYKLWVADEKKRVEHSVAFGTWMNRLNIKNPVLVFHPGKVGSSSVFKSITNYGMQAEHLCDLYYNIYHTDNRDYKKELFDYYKKHSDIKIISLVREPIARDISYFFQSAITDPEWHVKGRVSNDFIEDCKKILVDYTLEKNNIDKIYDWMDYIACNGKHGTEFDWFDFELKELFGIDIYTFPFDKEKGYIVIKKDNIEVLIIKMEKLNELETVIGDFVGIENFELSNDNVGSNKNYQYMYQELKDKIELPQEYIDFYYKNNEYFNWFYSEEEREAFKCKWEKKTR